MLTTAREGIASTDCIRKYYCPVNLLFITLKIIPDSNNKERNRRISFTAELACHYVPEGINLFQRRALDNHLDHYAKVFRMLAGR